MTTEERDQCFQYDREKRKDIVRNVLMIGLEVIDNKGLCLTEQETQKFYQSKYNNYLGNIVTDEKYKPSDFWFNDAGFQFKWRNFESNIQLECLSWNEVTKLVKQISA